MSFAEVLQAVERLGPVKKVGKEYKGLCPVHGDSDPSLEFHEENDGRVVIICRSHDCAFGDIAAGLMVQPSAFFPPKSGRQMGGAKHTPFSYRDEQGAEVSQSVRVDPADGSKKTFFQRHRGPNGEWVNNTKGVRRVVYGLPELKAADPSEPVWVVGGEKCVHIMRDHGFVASTNIGGEGHWAAADSEFLRGRNVVVFPDADDVGHRHGQQVAAALQDIAKSVKVVDVLGLPLKGDCEQYFNSGRTAEELRELAAKTPEWSPERESEANTAAPSALPEWPEPEPLPDGLFPVPAFDYGLLPTAFRPWLADVADRMQCPPEFPAVAAVVAAGSVIGRTCAIRPKCRDDWQVVANNYGALVGRPSLKKSPAQDEGLRPLRRLAFEASERFRKETEDLNSRLTLQEIKRDLNKKAARKRLEKGGKDAEALEELAEDPASAEPTEKRYVVNDATVEKLAEKLIENPRGLLLVRDELPGWFASLDRDGHENDRAFFLEAWNGTNSYTFDRIGRGTHHVPALCMSMIGCIQPGPLEQYLRPAIRGGMSDDGLIQRFQLLVYPDPPPAYRHVDRYPDGKAYARALEVFRRLDELTPATIGADIPEHDGLPFLRFAPDAQPFFDQWITDLMRRIAGDAEHPAIEAHLAKFPKLMASLSLIFHLVDAEAMPCGPVALASAQRAAAWCDLLEAHARRTYACVTHSSMTAAHALLAKLREKKVSSPFTARAVYQQGWTHLSDREAVESAVSILADFNWIRDSVVMTGGRPRTEYRAHPALVSA